MTGAAASTIASRNASPVDRAFTGPADGGGLRASKTVRDQAWSATAAVVQRGISTYASRTMALPRAAALVAASETSSACTPSSGETGLAAEPAQAATNAS